MPSNQAFLFLCHYFSRVERREFEKIQTAAAGLGASFVLFHATGQPLPAMLKNCNVYPFSYQTLFALNRKEVTRIAPGGNTHLPLIQFGLEYPHYDFYWLIEYDVRFTGSWRYFFESCRLDVSDLLTCHLFEYAARPDWYWWPSLKHPHLEIPLSDRLGAFNVIYRISNPALHTLAKCLKSGWRGHEEVFIPTLLHRHGFAISDFNNLPRFGGVSGTFYNRRTMWHLPPHWRFLWQKNKLYHPIKPLPQVITWYANRLKEKIIERLTSTRP